ncbi:hypothetical protein Q7P37_008688 [Cladosporium fusiforme]
MSSLQYYPAPGFGQVTRTQYGFSNACIVGDRMEVTGQVGKHPITLEVPEDLGAEVAQAFENLRTVIEITLEQWDCEPGRQVARKAAWDYVVKITSYHVGLSRDRSRLREIMVRELKARFPNHRPLFTMLDVESLPLEDTNVEIEAVIYLGGLCGKLMAMRSEAFDEHEFR